MSSVSFIIIRVSGGNFNKKRSGGPKAPTESEDKLLRVSSLRDKQLTRQQLQALSDPNKHVSVSTVKRILGPAGLAGRVAVRKPLLRRLNEKSRPEGTANRQLKTGGMD